MIKEDILNIIEKRKKANGSVLVSIEEFFNDNSNRWSFATNACNKEIDVFVFHRIFKELFELESTQNLWILIVDIDEDWPYSDTAFISTRLNADKLNDILDEVAPSEVSEVPQDNEIRKQITDIQEGYKLYCLWWD